VEAPAGACAAKIEANMPAKPTKIETILKLLRRPNGASIAQLQKTAGWQPHSVRAALTGLRKKGHNIERDKDTKGVTRYRVAGER
jgi:hypothetical protein